MGHDGRRFDCAATDCAHRESRAGRAEESLRKRAAFLLLINLVVFSLGLLIAEVGFRLFWNPRYWIHLSRLLDRLGPDRGGEEVVARYRVHGRRVRVPHRVPHQCLGLSCRPRADDGRSPYRIAFVGDSFTEAMQVPYESSFCARLESLLNLDAPRGRVCINDGSPPPTCSTTGTGSSTTC